MERLTVKRLGTVDIKGAFDVPCSDICENNFCRECPIQKAFNKLAEYEDLEEQGLLLKLPCKVGDTLYSAEYEKVEELAVSSFRVYEDGVYAYCCHRFIGEVGVSAFATKAEAEKALEEMEK